MKRILQKILIFLLIFIFIFNINNFVSYAGMTTTSHPIGSGGNVGFGSNYDSFTHNALTCLDWSQWWEETYNEDETEGWVSAGCQLIKYEGDSEHWHTVFWDDDMFWGFDDNCLQFFIYNDTCVSGRLWPEVANGDWIEDLLTTCADDLTFGDFRWKREEGSDFGLYSYNVDKGQYIRDSDSSYYLDSCDIGDLAIFDPRESETPGRRTREIDPIDEKKTLISKVVKDGITLYDRKNTIVTIDGTEYDLSKNENFYKYGKTSYDYEGYLYDGENNNYTIYYETINYHKDKVIEEQTYIIHTKGTETWESDTSEWKYSSGGAENYTVSSDGSGSDKLLLKYNVSSPFISTMYRPYDLNTMEPADEDEVQAEFPEYKKGAPVLDMSVNNYKNITDGSEIPGLDINSKIPFNITFNNDSFGMGENIKDLGVTPEEAEYVNYCPWATFSTKMNNNDQVDQTLYVDVTNYLYQGNPTFIINPANNTSITDPDGNEKKNGNELKFGLGFRGGTFNFKAIKSGVYGLTDEHNGFICVDYNKKYYAKQGSHYIGTYTIDNKYNTITIESSNDKVKAISENIIQPILKGFFKVNSIAGK